MISSHYIANQFRAHRVLFAFVFFFVGLFQVLIVTLVVGADMMGMVEQFFRQMPPQVQMVLGDQFMAQFSVNGAVAFGYAHPMVIVLVCLAAISLPSRHIAGEVETGTLELLFALPVRRPTVTRSLWLASASVLLIITVGGWIGTGVGMMLFPETRTMPVATLIQIGINLWLLAVAVSSYTLLISAYAREGGKATLRATGLTLVLYFLNISSLMWPPLGTIRPLSLFYYHQPQRLMSNTGEFWINAAVLIGVTLVCAVLAVRRVSRRDIPG